MSNSAKCCVLQNILHGNLKVKDLMNLIKNLTAEQQNKFTFMFEEIKVKVSNTTVLMWKLKDCLLKDWKLLWQVGFWLVGCPQPSLTFAQDTLVQDAGRWQMTQWTTTPRPNGPQRSKQPEKDLFSHEDPI